MPLRTKVPISKQRFQEESSESEGDQEYQQTLAQYKQKVKSKSCSC